MSTLTVIVFRDHFSYSCFEKQPHSALYFENNRAEPHVTIIYLFINVKPTKITRKLTYKRRPVTKKPCNVLYASGVPTCATDAK